MDQIPTFGLKQLLTQIVGDAAKAVSQRPGESQAQQIARSQAAVHSIMAFQPRDAIEAMLASHCMMFHELIVDSVQTTLCGEEPASRSATRSFIATMDKAFGNNLARLERYRTGQAEPAQPTHGHAETAIADRVRRHQSRTEPSKHDAATQYAPSASAAGTVVHDPAPQPIAAHAEAAAELDTACFAPAPGPEQPSETGLTAAQLPGLNRQARRAIDRQARKRAAPELARMTRSGVMPTHNGPTTKASATAAD